MATLGKPCVPGTGDTRCHDRARICAMAESMHFTIADEGTKMRNCICGADKPLWLRRGDGKMNREEMLKELTALDFTRLTCSSIWIPTRTT